jgi:uncharacterized protein YabE (DUF348 family)
MSKKFKRIQKRYYVSKRRKVRKLKAFNRHQYALPVYTFLVLILLGGVLVYAIMRNEPKRVDSKVAIISYDDQEQTVPTSAPTVGKLLEKLKIPVRDGDIVEPAMTTAIKQDNFRINIYRAMPVQVVDGGHIVHALSAAKTSRSIARQAGVVAYPEDNLVTVPITDFVRDQSIGEKVIIDRATPVNVNLYGSNVVMRTHAKTVGELIKEKKIKVNADDSISPALDTPLAANLPIFIDRHGIRLETVTQDIAMPVQVVTDPGLAYGTTAVRQQGVPGQKSSTYQIKLVDGVEVGRQLIQTVVVREPVTQILARGVNLGGIKGDMALAGIAPKDFAYVDYVIEHESHWNPAAVNRSGCYGLGQACPGSKLVAACPNWQADVVCQLRFFHGYAIGRYKSWEAAYNFKVSRGWW